jgi:hypothetical protein
MTPLRRHRGYALPITLAAIALLGALGFFVASQLMTQRLGTRAEEHRRQAIWLARTAAQAGLEGTHDVVVAGDRAHVKAWKKGSRVLVEATFPRCGTAHVEWENGVWTEQYDRVIAE